MDANVKYQGSLLEVKQGRLETTPLPGPRVICGTRSLGVSEILPERMWSFLKINLIRSWLTTPMCLGVVSLITHMTEVYTNQTLYDHYRDERYSRVINSITKKSLGV